MTGDKLGHVICILHRMHFLRVKPAQNFRRCLVVETIYFPVATLHLLSDSNQQSANCIFLDRCKVDDTLSFHPRPDPQSQRFSLEAFQYVSQQPFVFFHCRVKICNETDPNSRCAQGCLSRKRRSLKALPDTADDVYPLAQGPLTLNREKRDAQADEARESDQSMRVTSKYSAVHRFT